MTVAGPAGHSGVRGVRLAATAFALGGAAWFAVNLDGVHGPQLIGWMPGPLGLLLAAFTMRRVAGSPDLQPAARRFWHHFTVVTTLCAIGIVIHAYSSLTAARGEPSLPTPGAIVILLSLISAVWALLRLPIGPRTPAAWVRLSLDGATVILGAGLFMWYMAFAPMLAADRGLGTVWAQVGIGAMCLAGLAAVVKIALAGAGPVDMGALRMLGMSLLVGGVSAGAAPLIPPVSRLEPGQLSAPLIAWLLVAATDRQRRAVGRTDPGRRRPDRTYSLLPYAAVVATDVLLVLATRGPGDDRRPVVVAGAITITALVVLRQLVAFVDNARLVRQLRQHEDQLRHQATHDALTGLANRTLFGEHVDAALGTLRPDEDLAVLLVDLDDFKTVNDTLGHDVGDAVLAVVAQRIRHCAHPGGTVARLGGDEFAVMLKDASAADIDAAADRILSTLTQPLAVPGHHLLVQASIGVAVGGPGDDTGTVLRKADIAMYAAKESGKAGVARYMPGMAARILEHAQLGAHLRHALDRSQLHVLYQPIVRLADRCVVGMETLVRWRHPGRGLVPPAEFIPAAERTGLIVPLGLWVLREACRQQAAWRDTHPATCPATVSVNVSGRQLQEPGFVGQVAEALRDAGLQPPELVLEVTETAVVTGGQVLEAVKALHDLGVNIALDDFGTGHSSLRLIQICPVHILKLDKSFVDEVTERSAVARAVARIAEELGLVAVAEGIEDQEQADQLRRLGYELGQGFHLMRPLPASEVDEILSLGPERPLPAGSLAGSAVTPA